MFTTKSSFKTLTIILLGSLIGLSQPLVAEEYVYPVDVGVIDVTQEPWNMDNTGVEDVTAAFQQLVDETIARKEVNTPSHYAPYIIYFPDGVYRLTDSVVGDVLNDGLANGGLVIQGQSRDGTILRLDDNADGFTFQKYVIDYMAGNSTNNAFNNQIENLTIDVGAGNPGAVGLRFHANNTGAVRNLRIISSDADSAGKIGLEAVKNTNGPWLIRDLEIIGFNYALNLSSNINGRHMVSVQDLHIKNQKIAGINMNDFILNILNGTSVNSVPFLVFPNTTGMVNLINVSISSEEDSALPGSAIESDSLLYFRNVENTAFENLVEGSAGVLLQDLSPGEEWHSHPRNFLWEETPDKSLGLPIEQAPELPWRDSSEWAVVDPDLVRDDTEEIRAALASGKPMIVFKPGVYRITETIRIPPHVERVAGQFAVFRADSPLQNSGEPVFELGPSDHDVVLFEKMRGNFQASSNPNPMLLNGSHGTVVLRDIFWVSGPVYRNEPTRGKVFLENVHSLPGTQENELDIPAYEFRGHAVWAYQWNPEMLFPHAVVDGGSFWAFGWKTGEMRGPIVDVRNHGYAELFGGSMNVTSRTLDIDPSETLMLLSTNGNLSANFIENFNLSGGGAGWGRHNFVAVEERFGERRELLNSDPSVMHDFGLSPRIGARINLYTGYFDQDNPQNSAPEITNLEAQLDATGYVYDFSGAASDDGQPDLAPILTWRVISGPGISRVPEHVGSSATIEFEREGLYEVELSASDGALETNQVYPVRVVPQSHTQTLERTDAYRFTVSFASNGLANQVIPVVMQVGSNTSGDQFQVKFSVDITRLKGMEDRIDSAKLKLRINNLLGLEAISPSYTVAEDFGVANLEDFETERQSLELYSLSGKGVGDFIEVDILPGILHSLENDMNLATIWVAGEALDGVTAKSVSFGSTVESQEDWRPQVITDFGPFSLANSSTLLGEGIYLHPVYGMFAVFGSWTYHFEAGWLFMDVPGNSNQNFYFNSPESGWQYTTIDSFPWVYQFDPGEWVDSSL